MALPPLPGYSFNRNVGKEKFHKSQHWGFCNNVGMLLSEDIPGIGGEPLPGQKLKPKYSVYVKRSDAPAWVAFDKQVLCFYAYTKDELHDKSLGSYIIARYKIYFYPEDNTIQVNLPEMKNSGLQPGIVIQRNRISLPPPDEDQFYTVYHFNIGIDVVFYGRTYKIYDCDAFTKNFMMEVGVKLNPPQQCPEDFYMKIWRKKQDFVQPFRYYESTNTRQQFLDYNRKILRFFCLLDDSTSFSEERRKLVLRYFLIDGTIEIRELLPDNSGRHRLPFLLKRQKVPKYAPTGMYQPGDETDQIVLNVFSGYAVSRVHGYKMDIHKVGKLKQEFYEDSDLYIGNTINVWGRKVLICDCDGFTKTYYKTKYGIEDFTSIPCDPPPPPKIERKFPPYTGFGSEEDSLCSCIGLEPKRCLYQRKFNVFKEKDSDEGIVLRFLAKLITRQDDNKHRLFVISYFLTDGTMSVFEPTENSVSGLHKFLKRMRVKRPGQELFKSELSEYIKVEELYIGAQVNVNGYQFLLLNADEYTFNFMEKNLDKFPLCNPEPPLQMLKEKISKSKALKYMFIAADPGFTKKMHYKTFRDLVMAITAGKLNEQEFISVARQYQVPEVPCPETDDLIAVAHRELKKNTFENFEPFIPTCVYEDRKKKNVLPKNDIRRLCKSFRLPLTPDLLESLLSKFEDSEEQINYESFFNALNWRINPLPELVETSPMEEISEDDVSVGMPPPVPMECIDYFKFLNDMYGPEEE